MINWVACWHVDAAISIAGQCDRALPRQCGTVGPAAGSRAHPSRGIRIGGPAGQCVGIRLAAPAEERHVDAARETLIDQHAEVLATISAPAISSGACARLRINRPISGARMRAISFATALLFGIR